MSFNGMEKNVHLHMEIPIQKGRKRPINEKIKFKSMERYNSKFYIFLDKNRI